MTEHGFADFDRTLSRIQPMGNIAHYDEAQCAVGNNGADFSTRNTLGHLPNIPVLTRHNRYAALALSFQLMQHC